MKSNKGFTLIELLAVIVILAIIALIATPIILNVIDQARQGAAEQSALAYIQAVENQVVISQLTSDTTDDITLTESGATLVVGTDDALEKVEMKGTKPEDGSKIVLDAKGNATTTTCLVVKMNGKDYSVKYEGAGVVKTVTSCTE